jgi:hypothetical protein
VALSTVKTEPNMEGQRRASRNIARRGGGRLPGKEDPRPEEGRRNEEPKPRRRGAAEQLARRREIFIGEESRCVEYVVKYCFGYLCRESGRQGIRSRHPILSV